MIAWLRNPELAKRAQAVGEILRFGTTLEPALVEFATLVCAHHWGAARVWMSHSQYALAAGVPAATLAAIAEDRHPALGTPRETSVYAVATALLQHHAVPDDVYGHAVATLGERALVELVGLIGYYGMVCLTVNAFELGGPAAASPDSSTTEGAGR
jgi:4-carboxymuconolactone decarboxylase